MKRPKQILVRDDRGKLCVVLEIDGGGPTDVAPRYELANRSLVTRFSETQFVVVQTGAILTKTQDRIRVNEK